MIFLFFFRRTCDAASDTGG